MKNRYTTKGYIPDMILAAEYASEGSHLYSAPNSFTKFSSRAAFDMFSCVFFGDFTKTANPTKETNPADQEFCCNAILGLEVLSPMIRSPKEIFLTTLGIRS